MTLKEFKYQQPRRSRGDPLGEHIGFMSFPVVREARAAARVVEVLQPLKNGAPFTSNFRISKSLPTFEKPSKPPAAGYDANGRCEALGEIWVP
jgi:hypothetical protein